MPKTIDEVAGGIMTDMEKLLLERVYIAILKSGEVLYASTALDKHIELLKLFAITEFKDLYVYGHTFPLAGTNLGVFKISDDILLCLYTKKGYQGQLLSFKTKMVKYLDELKTAVTLPVRKPAEIEARGQILPKLVQTVSLTLGLSEDESAVLKLCDGNHSIKDIVDKTRIPRKEIVDIIRQYETKEWLKLETKGDIEEIPISIKKFPETAVRLGMISKKSYDINELCDGTNTAKDIADKLMMPEKELKKILQKMEKNKIVKMTVKIPEKEAIFAEIPAEEAAIAKSEEISNPELLLKPTLTANVSFSMGFDENERRILTLLDGSHSIEDLFHVTQISLIEIFKVIIKYEEKGWIRIPIDNFMHLATVKERLKSEYLTAELEEKYKRIIEERGLISEPTTEITGPIMAEEDKEREVLIERIQRELPLMPIDAQTKLVNKLMKTPPSSRESMLNKLLSADTSNKFRKIEKPEVVPAPPPPVPPITTPAPDTAPTPAPQQAPAPVSTPPPAPASTEPSSVSHPKPIIDETPLLKPSEILKQQSATIPTTTPQSQQPLISPDSLKITPPLESIEDKIAIIGEPLPPAQPEVSPTPEIPPTQESLGKQLPAESNQVYEVLKFIDSLLGIPEILYLALVDYNGTILYQTTKETELWDITKDILKMIQNWKAQAPSIYLNGIKFATIKATASLIATNIKGLGHIVAMPINEKLFLFTKMSKDGDVLLLSDNIATVAKQINEMF